MLSATPNGDAIIPEGFVRLFVLTSGEGLVIEQVSPLSSFAVDPSGSHTIHTLIFDPATLDLGIVEFGTTTGVDAYQTTVEVALPQEQNGVNTPAELLTNLNVGTISKIETERSSASQLTVIYPNPSANNIQVDFPSAFIGENITLDIMDTNGKIVKRLRMKGENVGTTIDISDLNNAMYTLRLSLEDGTISNSRFSKLGN